MEDHFKTIETFKSYSYTNHLKTMYHYMRKKEKNV